MNPRSDAVLPVPTMYRGWRLSPIHKIVENKLVKLHKERP